jgi:hypothetical protein
MTLLPRLPTRRAPAAAGASPEVTRRSGRRRTTTAAAVLGITTAVLLGGAGTAHAGVYGSGDCDRYTNATSISDPLPAGSYPGATVQAWLYRASSSQWVWTGAYTYARGTNYGTWVNPNGNMIQDLSFIAGRNSGAYTIQLKVTAANGNSTVTWVKGWEYDLSDRLSGYQYCIA